MPVLSPFGFKMLPSIDYQRCIGPVTMAERAVARFDMTLVRLNNHRHYQVISRLQDAVRSAHLDGHSDVSVEKLLVVLHDPMDSYQPTAVRAALAIHAALAKLHQVRYDRLTFASSDLARIADLAAQDAMAFDEPTSGDDLPDAGPLEDWIQACRPLADLPPMMAAALAFARFHELRPCQDVSPRIARVIAPLLFHALGLTEAPSLFLGHGLRRKDVDALRGPLASASEWIEVFCAATAAAADRCRRRVEHLHVLRNRYHAKFADSRSNNAARKVVDLLFERPLLDLSALQAEPGLGQGKGAKLSKRGSLLVMERLVNAGIVEEITDRERFRLYLAWDVARL